MFPADFALLLIEMFDVTSAHSKAQITIGALAIYFFAMVGMCGIASAIIVKKFKFNL